MGFDVGGLFSATEGQVGGFPMDGVGAASHYAGFGDSNGADSFAFDAQGLLSALTPLADAAAAVPQAMGPARIPGATAGCYGLEISDTQYHRSTEGISSSGLKQLMRSPAHYQAWLKGGNADTAARRFGRAVHAYVLERAVFDQRHAVWRGGDRKAAGYKDFCLANAGKMILTAEEMDRVEGCARALLTDPAFPLEGFLHGARDAAGNYMVKPARTEFVIIWVDKATGVTCKVRTDAMLESPAFAFDVKTTGDARPEAFVREIVRMHYDLQAAFYCEGVRRFTGKDATFIFGAVEGEGAYGTGFYGLGPQHDLILNGQRKFRHALDLYARCKAEDRWPGYGFTGVIEPVMEPWMAFHG